MTQQETSEFVSDLRRAFSAVEVSPPSFSPRPSGFIPVAGWMPATQRPSSRACVLHREEVCFGAETADANCSRGEWLCAGGWSRTGIGM